MPIRYYYGTDLFDGPPEGFSESVTIAGLLNHGAAGYPVEWAAIRADLKAQIRLVEAFVEERPVDFAFWAKLKEVVGVLSGDKA